MNDSLTIAIVQARVGSTRLPGKSTRLLAGRPLICHTLDRLRRVEAIGAVVLAFPAEEEDTVFYELAAAEGVAAFAGSRDDVLGRFAAALQMLPAETVIRVCGDNPVLAAELVPASLAAHRRSAADYTAMKGLPLGTGFEVVSAPALLMAAREAALPHQREHVTPFIWEQPERFRICRPDPPRPYPPCRLTVDTEKDWRLQEKIFGALYRHGEVFSLEDVMAILAAHPDWLEINRDVAQKPPTTVG